MMVFDKGRITILLVCELSLDLYVYQCPRQRLRDINYICELSNATYSVAETL